MCERWKYRNRFVTISEGTGSRLQAPWRSNFTEKNKRIKVIFFPQTLLSTKLKSPWSSLLTTLPPSSLELVRGDTWFSVKRQTKLNDRCTLSCWGLKQQDADEDKRSDLHELVFFHPLHDDGEDDWQKEGKKKSRAEEDKLKNSLYNIYEMKLLCILIPGAAMVIRETTTWVMPFTAAFCRRNTRFKDSKEKLLCFFKNKQTKKGRKVFPECWP